VCTLVFPAEADAKRALAQVEDAAEIAEGHDRWYVVKYEANQTE
jgi:hypothetical protein